MYKYIGVCVCVCVCVCMCVCVCFAPMWSTEILCQLSVSNEAYFSSYWIEHFKRHATKWSLKWMNPSFICSLLLMCVLQVNNHVLYCLSLYIYSLYDFFTNLQLLSSFSQYISPYKMIEQFFLTHLKCSLSITFTMKHLFLLICSCMLFPIQKCIRVEFCNFLGK